jgi:uncharacterized membrane protein
MSDIYETLRGPDPRGSGFAQFADKAHHILSPVLTFIVALFAVVAIGSVVFAMLGMIPWLTLDARIGDAPLTGAGVMLQSLLAALSLVLVLYLPSHARVAKLERSHRSFQMGTEDVARADRLAHDTDRKGVFTLSGEFDAMRERLNHMRRHPDLGLLEADILELAAQMSLQARDLAKVYSEEKVARAKSFLAQRQQEAQATEDQIRIARYACDEIRNWLNDVEADERRLSQQFQLLERDLKSVLPALGYEIEEPRDANVVQLTKPTK